MLFVNLLISATAPLLMLDRILPFLGTLAIDPLTLPLIINTLLSPFIFQFVFLKNNMIMFFNISCNNFTIKASKINSSCSSLPKLVTITFLFVLKNSLISSRFSLIKVEAYILLSGLKTAFPEPL